MLNGGESHDDRRRALERKALEGTAAETVRRHGLAAKEHLVAYSGHDRERGVELSKSLKSIARFGRNDAYRNSNTWQQAGFSAEVKSVARRNADAVIDSSAHRHMRTDDLDRVNDPLVDIVTLDAGGRVVPGTQA